MTRSVAGTCSISVPKIVPLVPGLFEDVAKYAGQFSGLAA
jgi:hypothetical protein